MKSFINILVVSLVVNLFCIAGESTKENEFVKVEFTLKQKTMRVGSSGELLISFKPNNGIHINLEPPIVIKLDSNEIIASVGKLDVPQPVKEGYLDISKPIKQSFTLSKQFKVGIFQIKGMLTYFYCSASNGWCSRFKQPIEVTVTVK